MGGQANWLLEKRPATIQYDRTRIDAKVSKFRRSAGAFSTASYWGRSSMKAISPAGDWFCMQIDVGESGGGVLN
ncbi:MAG: hypothetical protein Aurels2KO_31230 [Aureliella sp.]